MPFVNRVDAGQRLAAELMDLRNEDVVVLGLPRGGVPVAYEVARALGAPLDVIVVRKLGVPFQPELGMGAIGEGGVRIINPEIVRMARVNDRELAAIEERERVELDRRANRYRAGRERASLQGRTAIVVDDGIATGSTAQAACQVARALGASRVILAVPVAPRSSIDKFSDVVDKMVCVETPDWFFGVGQWYDNFSQTSDEEVVTLLQRASERITPNPETSVVSVDSASDPMTRDEEVEVVAGSIALAGHLTVPEAVQGIVIFAHGSGSSRHSPRNRFVAEVLNQAGLGTLLFDLLTQDEELDRSNVFDIALLATRLVDVTNWLRTQPEAVHLPIGYFGASTGAGAALWAASQQDADVAAVVSRGGRPDLAGSRLATVRAPTLLIVGGLDDVVLELNRQAQGRLLCENHLAVVPGATHLFEEPGTLETAANLARDWFIGHLGPVRDIS
jgi:putative phosphoribosyl transferase